MPLAEPCAHPQCLTVLTGKVDFTMSAWPAESATWANASTFSAHKRRSSANSSVDNRPVATPTAPRGSEYANVMNVTRLRFVLRLFETG
jgi:hypothetical protein